MTLNLRRLNVILLTLLVLIILAGCPSTPPGDTDPDDPVETDLFSLTIMHTNDLHARIMEFNKYGNTASAEESEAGGGSGIGGGAGVGTLY